ncbi:MAG: hypothetical protein WCO60_05640 [Verrucomicrobiota bacterium]
MREVEQQAKKDTAAFIPLMTRPQPLTTEAIEIFAIARALYRDGYFSECKKRITDFWGKYPRHAPMWGQQAETVGYKLGYPCVYPALVLLEHAVDWRLKEKTLPKPIEAVDWNITVLLVGKSSGFMPSNDEEAKAGTGKRVSTTIDPDLLANDSAYIHELTWLTREYYRAVTEGTISLRLSVLHLKDLEFEVHHQTAPPQQSKDLGKLSSAIPLEIPRQTDWYWLMYPEIDPPKDATNCYSLAMYGRIGGAAGGMTSMPGTNRPMFISPDHSLIRRTPHKDHPATTLFSQQIYIPYWLQHEFFHDHFGRNTHLELEVTSHQWFKRETWPADFVGRFEPDYYDEAMFKRLQTQAKLSLAGYFIHRIVRLKQQLTPENVVGRYSQANPQNSWGTGEIKIVKGKLQWVNDTGKSWGLTLKTDGILEADRSNPYFDKSPTFEMISALAPDGLPSGTGIGGFMFGTQQFLRKP